MAETPVATLPLRLFWAVLGCGLPESSFLICKMKRVTRESSKSFPLRLLMLLRSGRLVAVGWLHY